MALSASGAQTQAHSAPEAAAKPGGMSEPQHHPPQPTELAAAPVAPAQAERSAGDAAPAAMPAMFWDTLPEGESQHPDKLAMDAIMEELTPAERAANLKVCCGLMLAFSTDAIVATAVIAGTVIPQLGDSQQMHSNRRCLACMTPAATPMHVHICSGHNQRNASCAGYDQSRPADQSRP